MNDIAKGLLILIACFILFDVYYTETNTCYVEEYSTDVQAKCGILVKYFDIKINLFDRYW